MENLALKIWNTALEGLFTNRFHRLFTIADVSKFYRAMAKQKEWYLIMWFDRCVLRRSTKRELTHWLDDSAKLKRKESGWFEVENNRQEVTIARDDVVYKVMEQNKGNWDKFSFI